jgi:hypothetical protein
MFCTNCGNRTEEAWSFCNKCGATLGDQATPPSEAADDVDKADEAAGTEAIPEPDSVSATDINREENESADAPRIEPTITRQGLPSEGAGHSVALDAENDSAFRTKKKFFVLASSLVVLFAGAVVFQGIPPKEPIASTPTASATTAVSQATYSGDRGCRALDDANREVDLWTDMILTTEEVPDIYWWTPDALMSASDAVNEEFSEFLELMAIHYSSIGAGVNAGNHSLAKVGLQDYLKDVPKTALFCNGSVWIGEPTESQGIDTGTKSPEPASKQTQSQTASKLSSYDCAVVESNITMVRTVFTEGTATPSQIATILQGAASKWDVVAANQSGSRASWLSKMSELSLDLRGYILNGSPTNGEQLLDQLGNNFNLSTQFCG